jgi:hypothetical protein
VRIRAGRLKLSDSEPLVLNSGLTGIWSGEIPAFDSPAKAIKYRTLSMVYAQTLAREVLLGDTILNRGGTTSVPQKVMEALGLELRPGERSKLLWTLAGDEVIVTKGTPQSDWRKTMLRKNGTAAIPRHVQRALSLEVNPHGEERVLWIRKGDQIVFRKRARK